MSSSKKPAFEVVVLGGMNSDFMVRGSTLPQPGQTVQADSFYSGPGGKGANQAVAAARLGARVALISRVGSDDRGRELIRGLKREGIDTRHICFDDKAPTGAAIIAVDSKGEKQISSAPGANTNISVSQVREAEGLISGARVLLMQLEAPINCVLAAARLAKKHGVQTLLDPAPPREVPGPLFPLLDLIRPNSDEVQKITGIKVKDRDSARKAARLLLDRGVRIVAMESGEGGDLIMGRDDEFFLPRLKVKTVDATGAGDAFAGALAAGLAEGLSLKEAARLANATAALSTTKMGAQEALPTRAPVERFLKRQAHPKQVGA